MLHVWIDVKTKGQTLSKSREHQRGCRRGKNSPPVHLFHSFPPIYSPVPVRPSTFATSYYLSMPQHQPHCAISLVFFKCCNFFFLLFYYYTSLFSMSLNDGCGSILMTPLIIQQKKKLLKIKFFSKPILDFFR